MYKAKSNCIKDSSPIEAIIDRETFEKVKGLLTPQNRNSFTCSAVFSVAQIVAGQCRG